MGATAKAPSFSQSGESASRAKLTWEQVDEIRALKGKLLQRDIAERYGVSAPTVSTILAERTWKPETRHDLTKTQFVAEVVRRLNDRPTRTIARYLFKQWPEIFPTVKDALYRVQYVRGLRGENERRKLRDQSLVREPMRLVSG